jgi:transcriptional regulator with XRE-family HTH domain
MKGAMVNSMARQLVFPRPDNSSTTAGQRLRALRQARGLTQRQLAAAAGLQINEISIFENGHQGIGPKRGKQLAAALGVSPREIVDQKFWC